MGGIVTASARSAAAIDLGADTAAPFNALYIGVTGNVKVDLPGSVGITFANVPVGFFPVAVRKIYSTANGTSAASILGLSW